MRVQTDPTWIHHHHHHYHHLTDKHLQGSFFATWWAISKHTEITSPRVDTYIFFGGTLICITAFCALSLKVDVYWFSVPKFAINNNSNSNSNNNNNDDEEAEEEAKEDGDDDTDNDNYNLCSDQHDVHDQMRFTITWNDYEKIKYTSN